jgi:hypothetical protein
MVSMHFMEVTHTFNITTSRTDPYVEQANLNSTHCWKPSLVTLSVVRGQLNHRASPGGATVIT